MDVPAIREGGDVNFSTSFGERGQRSQLSDTNQIKHPFLFLTALGLVYFCVGSSQTAGKRTWTGG